MTELAQKKPARKKPVSRRRRRGKKKVVVTLQKGNESIKVNQDDLVDKLVELLPDVKLIQTDEVDTSEDKKKDNTKVAQKKVQDKKDKAKVGDKKNKAKVDDKKDKVLVKDTKDKAGVEDKTDDSRRLESGKQQINNDDLINVDGEKKGVADEKGAENGSNNIAGVEKDKNTADDGKRANDVSNTDSKNNVVDKEQVKIDGDGKQDLVVDEKDREAAAADKIQNIVSREKMQESTWNEAR